MVFLPAFTYKITQCCSYGAPGYLRFLAQHSLHGAAAPPWRSPGASPAAAPQPGQELGPARAALRPNAAEPRGVDPQGWGIHRWF